MNSNVDYLICPQCVEMRTAIVWFVDENQYQIVCRECAHEFESGKLPWESIRLVDMDVWEERDADADDDLSNNPWYLAERGDISPLAIDDYLDHDEFEY